MKYSQNFQIAPTLAERLTSLPLVELHLFAAAARLHLRLAQPSSSGSSNNALAGGDEHRVDDEENDDEGNEDDGASGDKAKKSKAKSKSKKKRKNGSARAKGGFVTVAEVLREFDALVGVTQRDVRMHKPIVTFLLSISLLFHIFACVFVCMWSVRESLFYLGFITISLY